MCQNHTLLEIVRPAHAVMPRVYHLPFSNPDSSPRRRGDAPKVNRARLFTVRQTLQVRR